MEWALEKVFLLPHYRLVESKFGKRKGIRYVYGVSLTEFGQPGEVGKIQKGLRIQDGSVVHLYSFRPPHRCHSAWGLALEVSVSRYEI